MRSCLLFVRSHNWQHNLTDLWAWPAVSVAGPQQSDQVEAEEGAQQSQHHEVLRHGGKQLCCASHVHVIGHHKEGAAEQGEVVAQTLRLRRCAFLSHLRRQTLTDDSRRSWNKSEHRDQNVPGSHRCSTPPSLCASTSTWSWKKKYSELDLVPTQTWRAWCRCTKLPEFAVTSLGLSSSDSLLLQQQKPASPEEQCK